MTTRILTSLIFAASCTAMAAESNGSQYQWQTPADKFELTPAIKYSTATLKNKGTPSTHDDFTGFGESLRGEYGISQQFSAGLLLENVSTKDKSSVPNSVSTTQSGLMDPVAFFHGRSDAGGGSVRYGADLGFSLGKAKRESNGNSNNASGGISLAPFVGYEMNMGSATAGARLTYKLYTGDRSMTSETTTPATEAKISGPNVMTLGLFYEANMQPLTLGAALEVISTDKATIKITNVTPNTKTASATDLNIKIYAPYEITPTVTLLPVFDYTIRTAYDKSASEGRNGWDLGVGARFAF